MTIEETGVIMDILATAYPRFYSGPDAPDRMKTLTLWAEMFVHDDVALVAAAVKALIEADSKGFPPHVGAVKEKLRFITGGAERTEAEAWALVRKAVRNSGYEAREEFEKLPEAVRRIVGAPSQLRDWALMDSDTLNSVVASNFQRSYRAAAQREREIASLPPDVRALVDQLAERKTMDVLPEKTLELPQKPEDRAAPIPRERIAAAISPGTGRSREEVIAALMGGT